MDYETRNINTLVKLKEILNKHKINYSLSKQMVDFIKNKDELIEEPEYRIVLNYKDYFKIKRIENKYFFDNNDSLDNFLLPCFKDDESVVYIDLLVPTNIQIIKKIFKYFVLANFSYIRRYPEQFTKTTQLKVKTYNTFCIYISKKFFSLNSIINKFLVNEFTQYILLSNNLEHYSDSIYENISFLSKNINYKKHEFKYFSEFEK